MVNDGKFVISQTNWPVFALGYPLCASIEAIETNSISDTQKLITYWISFSLILLFERAFVKLLEWISFWPYIKLIIVCCLVIPQFDGSLYVYKHLVHPCLSLDPKIVISQFKKLKAFLKEDNLVVEVERHKNENSPDALQNFIAFKPKVEEPKVAHKDVNAVEIPEKKEVMSTEQCKFGEPKAAYEDVSAVEIREKKEVVSTKQVSHAEPGLAIEESRTFASLEMKEEATAAEGGWDLPEIPPSQKVQKEWTCAICQVTTQSETILYSHLHGKRHKAACEELKAKNQTLKSKVSPPSAGKKSNVPMETEAVAGNGLPDMPPPKIVQEWTCAICQVTGKSEIDFQSHLQGRRHKAACEELKAKNQTLKSKVSATSPGKKSNVPVETGAVANNGLADMPPPKIIQKKWTCAMCQVTSKSEIDFRSHLQGKQHKAACEELKAKNQTLKSKVSAASVGTKSNMPEGEPEKSVSDKGTSPENRKHKSKKQENPKSQGVEIRNSLWWCTICNISCTSKGNMDSHINGSKHLARAREVNVVGGSGHA